MKKRFFKFFSLFFVFFLIFTACSDQSGVEIVPEYDTSIDNEDINLEGYEYVIAAATHGGGKFTLSPVSGEDIRGDRLLQRYKDTEEKYNVKISTLNGCDLNMFKLDFVAGRKYADLMLSLVGTMFTGKYIQNGYFLAFSDMDIDLESGIFGTQGALEAGCFNNKYYGVLSYYWGFPTPYTMPAMWFNPKVISAYQQTSPHELDEQGLWTWDTFEAMCEAIRDTSDPDPDKHVYAIAYTSEPYLEYAALFSNGARFVEKNEDGTLSYALDSEAALEALTWVRDLAARDLICDGGDRQNITPFVENRRAFFLEYTHLGLSTDGTNNLGYQMEDAYEWILFPKGPQGLNVTAQTVHSYNSYLYYAPVNSDAEIHSILLPYLFQPLPDESADNWQSELERNNFYTSKSFEYFQKTRDDAFFDYTPFIPFSKMNSVLKEITRGTASASESLESIKDQFQTSLDDMYNSYLN